MTVQFYSYLAAVEVQPQSVATPTHKFTRARYTLIGVAPLPGQAIDCPGQILQIRDCPGDSGTVGAYGHCTSDLAWRRGKKSKGHLGEGETGAKENKRILKVR